MTQPESNPYPLDEPLSIGLNVKRGEKTFQLIHRIEMPTVAEWNRYFEQAAVTRREKRQLVIEDRSAQAGATMYEAHIQSVEGYTAGGRPIEERDDWREKIPLAHKIRVLERLGEIETVRAGSEDQDGFELGDSNEKTVSLIAHIDACPIDLTHRLRMPDASRVRRYESARASRRINGQGESIGSGWLAAAAILYDESILSVEGYQPPDPARVPALHKKAVVDSMLGAGDRWADSNDTQDEWEKN